MKFFKDVQKIILDLANLAQEKSTSPLAGTFTFFFLLYNWKPLFYFFGSDDTPKIKISHIEGLYAWDYCLNLFIPLFFAILSLLAYTVISGFTILSWRVLDDGLDKLTLKILKQATFLTHEQEKTLREDMEVQAVEHRKVVDVYEQQLRSFRTMNNKLLLQNKENKLEEVIDKSTPSESLTVEDREYFVSTMEGRLKLDQYVGKVANLDIDDSNEKVALKSLNYLILAATKDFPNVVTMNTPSITLNMEGGNQSHVTKASLKTNANKLQRLNLFEVTDITGGFEYKAKIKLIEGLIQMLPKIDGGQ
jgi:hypothetical protein